MPEIARKWEVVLVDDGSTDRTRAMAEKLASENNHLRVISHHPNRGYGAALQEGFANSRYEYIVFTDGDGQFDLHEMIKFAQKIPDFDIVIGYRKKRNDQSLGKRLLLMNMLKIWDFVFFHFYFRDIDCGFKMFKKSAVQQLLPLRSEGAMVTTELLAKAARKKLTIAEVGVEHYPRKFGEQTGANLAVVTRAVIETFMIWLDIKNKRF